MSGTEAFRLVDPAVKRNATSLVGAFAGYKGVSTANLPAVKKLCAVATSNEKIYACVSSWLALSNKTCLDRWRVNSGVRTEHLGIAGCP